MIVGGGGETAEFRGFEVFFRVDFTAVATVLKVLGEVTRVLVGFRRSAKVAGASGHGAGHEVARSGAEGGFGEVGEAGGDLARESAGHFEEFPGEEEGDDLDCHTEDEEHGRFGGGDNDPANQRASAEEDAKEGVEDEH